MHSRASKRKQRGCLAITWSCVRSIYWNESVFMWIEKFIRVSDDILPDAPENLRLLLRQHLFSPTSIIINIIFVLQAGRKQRTTSVFYPSSTVNGFNSNECIMKWWIIGLRWNWRLVVVGVVVLCCCFFVLFTWFCLLFSPVSVSPVLW